MKSIGALVAAVSATVLAASGAHAGINLITNGSFETGDFTGWTLSGNVTDTSAFNVENGGSSCEDGQYCVFAAQVGPLGYISQGFSDTPGDVLTVSFWVSNTLGGSPTEFSAVFDPTKSDINLVDETDFSTSGWAEYTFTERATGHDSLTFGFMDNPEDFLFDNVVVTEATAPEPAAWALMLAGFAGLGAALRKRRNFAVA